MMAQLKMNGGEVNEDMLRHMILNSVRNYQKKYAPEYGEITLCTDAAHPWRRDYYPLYKANRKKTREASGMDEDGNTVTTIFDGQLEDLGSPKRTLGGTWRRGNVSGDFLLTRD